MDESGVSLIEVMMVLALTGLMLVIGGEGFIAAAARQQSRTVHGVLYTAGDLSFEGQPHVYGALVTEGRVLPVSTNFTPIEVWYNHDLRSGFFRGLPLVYVASGTWQLKY